MFQGFFSQPGTLISTATDEAAGAFALQQVSGFPYEAFEARREIYKKLQSIYDGTYFEEKQQQGNKYVDKYPVRMNPAKGACYKHAYALWGEVSDNSKPLAYPIFVPKNRSMKEAAKKGQDFLTAVYTENNGRSVLMKNSLLSQYLGGSVLKASYVPFNPLRTIKLKIESVHPDNFIGVPMPGDELRLQESWFVSVITHRDAQKYYNVTIPEDEIPYFIEYWNLEEYRYSINNKTILSRVADPLTGAYFPFEGKNPYGFVPAVYIPRIRSNDFWGETLLSNNVVGILEEINRRIADYGDAVSDDSHRYVFLIGNAQGRPEVYEPAPGLRMVEIRVPPNYGQAANQQTNIEQSGAAKASQTMGDLVDELYSNFRREAFIPAVADGEDEGSQRSGQTLHMRMWPLTSHIGIQRHNWTDGLNLFDRMLTEMALSKKLYRPLPSSLRDIPIERRWAPILPKDKEAFVNQIIDRAAQKLGSLKHLLSLLDDIDDPEGEYEAIKEEIKELGEIDTELMKERFENDNANQFDGNTGRGTGANRRKSGDDSSDSSAKRRDTSGSS